MMRGMLRQIPLFSDLDEHDLETVASLVTVRQVPKQSIVVQEGEPGDAMYIIIRGAVKISYYTADGQEVVLALLEAGAFFGEMALLDDQPRSATVITMADSELAQIRRVDFDRLLKNSPELTRKMLTEVVARLRRTSLVLERISTMDVPHRLYSFLCDYCKSNGTRNAHGVYEIELPTHQLLADQLSTSRETISRAIGTLKKEGILTPLESRGRARINMEELETLLFALR